MNHFKDKEEEFENTKWICRFLNATVAEEVFDGKKVVVTTSTKDILFDQMSKDLKNKYTPEELEDIMNNPKRYSEYDRIEKV